jgi:asparagine synthase (glutamine-hydrolysing)
MCGITGAVSKYEVNISHMLACIKHRGPDGEGFFIERGVNKSAYNIFMGHRRLSIIDLTDCASQPFSSIDDSIVIVFNGEIYNYQVLRKQYLDGAKFKSSSDTEVIIELYKRYGTISFGWLSGMFAFVIYDKLAGKILMARDGLGIKPLYYFTNKDCLYFGSEIRTLRDNQEVNCSISKNAITEFFLNGFIYEPHTGFKHIHKVFPGSFIEVTIGVELEFSSGQFWKPGENLGTAQDLNVAIREEYQKHLVADVPIGLFYSGGVDSTVLLALSDDSVASYFIENKKESAKGDRYYAPIIAKKLGKKYNVIKISEEENTKEAYLAAINHVAKNSEELIADYTFIVSETISQEAKRKGLKVMLSGMGGDEVFLGYPRYKLIRFRTLYYLLYKIGAPFIARSRSFQKKFDRLKCFFESKSFTLQYSNLVGYFNEHELKNLLVGHDDLSVKKFEQKMNRLISPYKHLEEIKQAQIMDLYGFLSHNFSVADKSSMQAGVEIRVPLATTQLYDIALSRNIDELLSFREQKKPLLRLLDKYISKDHFKRSKQGFNPDLKLIIDSIGQEDLKELLCTGTITEILAKDYVYTLITNHFSGRNNNTYKLYQLLYFKFWINHYKSVEDSEIC